MKNVFFAFAFMLIGAFAFANEVEDVSNNEFNLSSIETIDTYLNDLENAGYTTVIIKTVVDDLFCVETHFVYVDVSYIGSFEVETYGVNGECGVTIHWL